MTRLIAISTLVAAISIASIADASAWTRNGSFSGPRGTTNYGGSGSCSGGSCSSTRGGTGPAGRSWSGQSSSSCSGGSCTHSGSGTGPAGNSYNHTGSVSR